jgi:sugar porter (SP) family MFS transporter
MALNWNWLAAACLCTLVLNVFLLFLVPESPRWLISQTRRDEALESLYWLYDMRSEADKIFKELEVDQSAQSTENFALREVVSPGVYKPILISMGLMFLQPFSGINTIIFYSSTTFQNAGFNSNPATPTLIVGAILVVATAVSCVLMDRAGRCILLFISGVLMTLSMTSFGVYYYITEVQGRTDLSWLSLSSVIIFVSGFSIGWGPIPWLVTSEIIPVRIRSVANGLATATNWICVFLTTQEYPDMMTAMHSYGAIWFFAGFCFLGIFFVLFFLPETKGRSLEEIQNQFQPADISFS